MHKGLPEGSLAWLRKMAKEVAAKVGMERCVDTLAEMVQEGCLIILENAHLVDPRKGQALGYLRRPVRRAMHDLVSAGLITTPTRVQVDVRKVRSASVSLGAILGRPATEAEIALELGMTINAVRRALSRDHKVFSGDADSDEGLTLWSRQASDEPCPMELLLAKEQGQRLYDSIDQLSQREAEVIWGFFGLDERLKPKKLRELASELEVTTARVHQIKDRALDLLRQSLAN